MKPDGNPVLNVSKNHRSDESEIVLANGVKVRIIPVSAALIEAVTRSIKDPEVPTYFDETVNKNVPNPANPDYVAALGEVSAKRNVAVMDAMVMFGVELPDGVPQDDGWLKKLTYLNKNLGYDIGLDGYDLEDSMDREYIYKRFILAGGNLLEMVMRASGISQEDIASAESTFRGN